MPGLVPGIHVFFCDKQDVDGRDKPGHDGGEADAGAYSFAWYLVSRLQ
jgi:hypothetical protein